MFTRAVLFERQLCLGNDYLEQLTGLASDVRQVGDVIAVHLHRNRKKGLLLYCRSKQGYIVPNSLAGIDDIFTLALYCLVTQERQLGSHAAIVPLIIDTSKITV